MSLTNTFSGKISQDPQSEILASPVLLPARRSAASQPHAAAERSNDETDGQTDGRTDARPLRRPCSAYYAISISNACTCGDKGGLLQLSSLGYFRTTVTTAAVCQCLQRRRSSRVLRKEVGAHNSTSPWTTLAESSRENSVPVMCSRVSLPYRHGAVIPYWNLPRSVTADVGSCRRLRSASTSTLSYRAHDAPRWVIEPSRWLLLKRGMLFRRLFVLRHRCCSSAASSRRHCFSHRTLHRSVQLCDRL